MLGLGNVEIALVKSSAPFSSLPMLILGAFKEVGAPQQEELGLLLPQLEGFI